METPQEKLLIRRDQITAELKVVWRKVKELKERTAELAIEKIRINQKLNQTEGE